MTAQAIERFLPDEAATQRLGEDLAMALRTGDVLALSGDLGAGKSTLARALIRARADDPALDVPSPTFTLVQSYEGRLPVHHFDLYRLSSSPPRRADELGFGEACRGAALSNGGGAAGLIRPPVTVEVLHQGEGVGAVSGEGEGFPLGPLAFRATSSTARWGAPAAGT